MNKAQKWEKIASNRYILWTREMVRANKLEEINAQLLEACEATIEALDPDNEGDCDAEDCPSCKAVRLSKAAIAKARGGE